MWRRVKEFNDVVSSTLRGGNIWNVREEAAGLNGAECRTLEVTASIRQDDMHREVDIP